MNTFFSEHWRSVHRFFLGVTIPSIILVWTFLFLIVFFTDAVFIIIAPLLYIASVILLQNCRFYTDYALCTDRIMYDRLQAFFHDNFKQETLLFRFKRPVFMFVHPFPSYRCRCAMLKKWYHKEEKHV